MLQAISKVVLLGLLFLGAASTAQEFQADELREKAIAMLRESAGLAQEGSVDSAKRLEKEALELLREADRQEVGGREKAPRPEIEREIGHLKERLQDLLARERQLREMDAAEPERAEVREQIAGTERELKALRKRLDGSRPPRPEFEAQARKIEEAGRRIHHMRVAAENLKAAEIHDVAMQLMEKAEVMEREVVEAKERLAGEMERRGKPDPRDAEIRELREQNERLRDEIRELRQNLERR